MGGNCIWVYSKPVGSTFAGDQEKKFCSHSSNSNINPFHPVSRQAGITLNKYTGRGRGNLSVDSSFLHLLFFKEKNTTQVDIMLTCDIKNLTKGQYSTGLLQLMVSLLLAWLLSVLFFVTAVSTSCLLMAWNLERKTVQKVWNNRLHFSSKTGKKRRRRKKETYQQNTWWSKRRNYSVKLPRCKIAKKFGKITRWKSSLKFPTSVQNLQKKWGVS